MKSMIEVSRNEELEVFGGESGWFDRIMSQTGRQTRMDWDTGPIGEILLWNRINREIRELPNRSDPGEPSFRRGNDDYAKGTPKETLTEARNRRCRIE